jgi:hypothetical protein
VSPEVVRGTDFVAVRTSYTYTTAAPDKMTGSKWTQNIVFPKDKRYFISSDRIAAVNSSDAMFLRVDMPGHIKHNKGDTFSHVYLSYLMQTNRAVDYKLMKLESLLLFALMMFGLAENGYAENDNSLSAEEQKAGWPEPSSLARFRPCPLTSSIPSRPQSRNQAGS